MKNEDLVKAAKTLIGKKYVWGGECEYEGGYDCSGLFYASMKIMGEKIARLSSQGYFNKYRVKRKHAFPMCGDILFFGKSEDKISHMAIATSETMMIESRGNSKNTKVNPGKGVCISQIKRRSDLVAIIDIFSEENKYYPIYKGKSNRIDEVFGLIGAPYGNVSKRRLIAAINGIDNYKGTYLQNIKLVKLAKEGKLKRF